VTSRAADVPGSGKDERRLQLQDGLLRRFVGCKVSLSTSDFHHLVGHLIALLPDGSLQLRVKDADVVVGRHAVARIHAADAALAEYIK
jgi:hypothetical protein